MEVTGNTDADAFWNLSFREYQIIIDGGIAKTKRERSESMSIAWHIAAFSRVKKMPRHRDVVDDPKKPGRRMSPDELQAAVAGWLSKRKR